MRCESSDRSSHGPAEGTIALHSGAIPRGKPASRHPVRLQAVMRIVMLC